MTGTGGLFLDVVRNPGRAASLSTSEWASLITTARTARLLPRLTETFDRLGLTEGFPERVQHLLAGDRPLASQHDRIVRWEVNRIQAALHGIDTRLVLLKGAAYVLAHLPAARGRLVTDVDVLVPQRDLRRVEEALLAAGWSPVELDSYDERYYREWTHELPPLQHRRRRSVLDVHHNILPVTGRLHPDADKLLGRAVPIGPGLWTLGPEDMVLHNAVHLFQDGDLAGSVRDLVDADSLVRHFLGTEVDFETRLIERARDLGLGRPLYYTLRYANRMLGTPPIPEAGGFGPAAPVRRLMDSLVERALLPVTGRSGTLGEDTARLLLYVRSHWLRMPAGTLASHLFRKSLKGWRRRSEE